MYVCMYIYIYRYMYIDMHAQGPCWGLPFCAGIFSMVWFPYWCVMVAPDVHGAEERLKLFDH